MSCKMETQFNRVDVHNVIHVEQISLRTGQNLWRFDKIQWDFPKIWCHLSRLYMTTRRELKIIAATRNQQGSEKQLPVITRCHMAQGCCQDLSDLQLIVSYRLIWSADYKTMVAYWVWQFDMLNLIGVNVFVLNYVKSDFFLCKSLQQLVDKNL